MTDSRGTRDLVDEALPREHVEDLLDCAPCGYLYTTPDGVIVRANHTLLAWLGYKRDEVVGTMRFVDLLRAGSRLYHETHFAPLLHMHGRVNEIALDLVRADGQVIPVLVSAVQHRDPASRPLFHQITLFNASERRQYERELLAAKQQAERAGAETARLNAELARNNALLREREERLARANVALRHSEDALTTDRDQLRQILDALPVAVLLAAADGHIVRTNAAARRLFGGDLAGQALPSTSREVLDVVGVRRPDDTPFPLEDLPLRRSLRDGAVVEHVEGHIGRARDGCDVPVLISSAPLCGAGDEIAGAVAVLQDITPLKELARAREEFLGAAAHDLRTPLTIARGQAQLARRRLTRLGLPEAEPVLAQLDGIEASTRQMAALINQVVDMTRLQMGARLELQRRPTDLVALVRTVVAQQQGLTRAQFVVEGDRPELLATVDRERLERVLSNLVGNAVKYSPAGGEIVVRVAQAEQAAMSWAVLVVRDQGIGIPAADLPHIFERYYRARNARTHIQGTGIGLATVRQIVEQHGGTVTLTSQEGVGTTVSVRLPLTPTSGTEGRL